MGLIPGRAGLADEHIIVSVLLGIQPVLPGKRHAEIADGLGVAGAVGDPAQFLKIVKYPPGGKGV